jgi:large subunit ribosomal protein L25
MEVKLVAEPRTGAGKGVARKLRAGGRVPAVVYGPETKTQHLSVNERELWHALHTDSGLNVLIDLKLDGEEYLTMPREVQRDIVRGTLMHVDFVRIRRDVAIQVEVPVHVVGDSPGQKAGGVVETHLFQLRIEVLPTDVPEHLEADITGLEIGDSISVGSVQAPEGVTILNEPDETLVSVIPPPVLEVEAPPEEEAELAEGEEVPEGEAPAEGEGAEGAAPAEGGGEAAEGGEG